MSTDSFFQPPPPLQPAICNRCGRLLTLDDKTVAILSLCMRCSDVVAQIRAKEMKPFYSTSLISHIK